MGVYAKNPIKAINTESFQKWAGFAFERLIRRNVPLIALILGFSGVDYGCGVYFSRSAEEKSPGYQIDVIFERKDRVYTICEIKYYMGLVDTNIIDQVERKIALFPNTKKYTIQRVLITTQGATKALRDRHYFDKIIVLEDLFNSRYW